MAILQRSVPAVEFQTKIQLHQARPLTMPYVGETGPPERSHIPGRCIVDPGSKGQLVL